MALFHVNPEYLVAVKEKVVSLLLPIGPHTANIRHKIEYRVSDSE